MRRYLVILMIAALALVPVAGGAEIQVSVVQPSPDEALIAPGRDFYVIAKLTGAPEGQPESLFVRLVKDGRTMREVRQDANANAFKTDYELLSAFNTEADEWLMPELLYDPNDPDSLSSAWNKCYYHEGYIVAQITGGLYHDYIKHVNEDGSPFAQLAAGEYEVEVEIAFPTGEKAVHRFPIKLGTIPAKVLSRFSPATHFYLVIADAQERGLRVFNDAFPGYWSPPSIFVEATSSPYFAEIKPKWQFSDGIEYVTGDVYLYVYNITATCASHSTEIGILQAAQAFGTNRVHMFNYDIGEPELSFVDLSGNEVALSGAFDPVEPGDALVLCRAEITRENRDDNVTQIYKPEEKGVDSDLADGVSAKADQFLTILGVTPPFQNEDKDIVPLDDNSFQPMNRVTSLEYTFTQEGKTRMTATRDIGLARFFEEGWQNTSIYEFAHTFDLSGMSGEVNVRVNALDTYAKPVPGGEEAFVVTVG